MRHDRTVAMVGRNSQDWLSGSRVAIDPLSGEAVGAVTVSRYGSFTQYLENLSTGATLFQFPNDPQGATLMPMAVRFDSSGVLYVAVVDQDEFTSIFRFAPGDPIAFDVNGPANMVPGGVALQGFCFDGGDMAVGGNGTVEYVPCSLVEPGKRSDVLRAPGPNGALFETSQLPDFGYADGTLWYLGARCNGRTLAAGASWGGNSPVSLVDLTDGSVIATIAGLTTLRGFGTDGYDNLYVHGLFPVGGRYRWGLRRLTVGDLPSGFYGTPPPGVSVATQRASALFDAPADPATIPAEWLARRRQRANAPSISPRGKRSDRSALDAGQDGGHRPAQAPGATARMPTRARAAAVTELGLPPDLFCAPSGQLVVEIDGKYYSKGQEATVALGRELDLTAWWYQGLNPVGKVAVHWELDGSLPAWEQEHVAAAASGLVDSQAASETAVLFPDDVLLLFDEGNPDATVPDRKVWPIHNGTVNLKVHANTTPAGHPADVEVQVAVTYVNVQLGGTWNYYDPSILRWASAFGFPPQYIKGLIEQESAFDPADYRYEPAEWDFGAGLADKLGVQGMLTDAYFAPFRFEEPGGMSATGNLSLDRGPFLSQGDIDARTDGPRLYTFPGLPGVCQPVTPGVGPVSAWYLYLGSNGYVNDTSKPPAPCGQRMRWEPTADIYRWDSERRTARPSFANEATWWFYQNQDYIAQTFLAASYGLMQVGYAADLKDMRWYANEPDHRHVAGPANGVNVLAPNTNIYLGVRWLAWPGRLSWVRNLLSQVSPYEARFTGLLGRLLCTYNHGGGKEGLRSGGCGYDALVAGYAAGFGPTLEGQ